MFTMNPATLAIRLVLLLLSLSVHELAHALVADRLGDHTPRITGRLTLNPLAHLDPVGALALLLTGRFGWAKPVQVNPRNFENPEGGMVAVSLAGPLSNIALALVFAMLLKGVIGSGLAYRTSGAATAAVVLDQAIWINLGLAVFNLMPVPPLDGSKVLRALLRGRVYNLYYQLEQYSYIILLAFIATPVASWVLSPIIVFLYRTIM